MASGKTHRLINLTAAIMIPGGALASYYFSGWGGLAVLAVGYALSTYGVNPDKDIWRRTYDERKGWWGRLLFWWGLPYGLLFRHRGVSHWHLFGTLSRALFMGLWLLPVGLAAVGLPLGEVWRHTLWFFLGLTIADSLHIAADGGQGQREHRRDGHRR